jgi:hypothetical protein
MSEDSTGQKKNGGETRTKYPGDPELAKKLPPTRPSNIELEGSEQTFSSVLGTEIGIGQKDAPQSRAIPEKIDPYQWLERTSLTNDEIDIFRSEIMLAEHGIGSAALDIPMPEIAEDVIVDLRARRSRTDGLQGQSSVRFENEMTAWLQKLKAEAEERAKQASKGVGA